jgi:hypothetical protein
MRRNKNNPAVYLSWIAGLIIVLLPFHAFLTVWLSSLFGHYTLLRLWKEFLLVPLAAGSIYYLLRDKGLRDRFLGSWLIRLILIYFLVLAAGAAVPLMTGDVSAKAAWYGLLVDSRFLVFFLAVFVLAAESDRLERSWRKLLLAPAVLVAAFAVLQYLVLPYDFLKHFGYGDATISPYETINHNINHIRVASTLRGANPLGAYLILPISTLAVYLLKEKRQRLDKVVLGGGMLLALVFSFSRSAWIGAVLAVAVICWQLLSGTKSRRIILYGIAVVTAAAVVLTLALHDNHAFQETFLHTETASASPESSNYGHRAAMERAVKDIFHHPFGGGAGTAGPQSVYNNNLPRIAENYYLQIGQETGLIGLVLFVAITVLMMLELYRRRTGPMALALFASLAGISLVGLLSHVWADDTLAYIWWGLAAICLSPVILSGRRKLKNGEKIKP